MLRETFRRSVQVARPVTQRLIKRSYQLLDRADVPMREVEAALDALHTTLDRPNSAGLWKAHLPSESG